MMPSFAAAIGRVAAVLLLLGIFQGGSCDEAGDFDLELDPNPKLIVKVDDTRGNDVDDALVKLIYGFDAAPDTQAVAASEPGARFLLHTPYPAPADSVVTIDFELPERAHVLLEVRDPSGAVVRTLIDEALDAGSHRSIWYGGDELGHSVANGLYFTRFEARSAQADATQQEPIVLNDARPGHQRGAFARRTGRNGELTLEIAGLPLGVTFDALDETGARSGKQSFSREMRICSMLEDGSRRGETMITIENPPRTARAYVVLEQ